MGDEARSTRCLRLPPRLAPQRSQGSPVFAVKHSSFYVSSRPLRRDLLDGRVCLDGSLCLESSRGDPGSYPIRLLYLIPNPVDLLSFRRAPGHGPPAGRAGKFSGQSKLTFKINVIPDLIRDLLDVGSCQTGPFEHIRPSGDSGSGAGMTTHGGRVEELNGHGPPAGAGRPSGRGGGFSVSGEAPRVSCRRTAPPVAGQPAPRRGQGC